MEEGMHNYINSVTEEQAIKDLEFIAKEMAKADIAYYQNNCVTLQYISTYRR